MGTPLDEHSISTAIGEHVHLGLTIGTVMHGTLAGVDWTEDGDVERLWLDTSGERWSAPKGIVTMVWLPDGEE